MDKNLKKYVKKTVMEKRMQIARNCIREGRSLEEIADATKLSMSKVRKLDEEERQRKKQRKKMREIEKKKKHGHLLTPSERELWSGFLEFEELGEKKRIVSRIRKLSEYDEEILAKFLGVSDAVALGVIEMIKKNPKLTDREIARKLQVWKE